MLKASSKQGQRSWSRPWRVNTSPEVVLLLYRSFYQTKPHIRQPTPTPTTWASQKRRPSMGSLFSRAPAAVPPSGGREKAAAEVNGLPPPSGSTMGALEASSAPRPALASGDERTCLLPGLPAACLEATFLARFLSDTWFRLFFHLHRHQRAGGSGADRQVAAITATGACVDTSSRSGQAIRPGDQATYNHPPSAGRQHDGHPLRPAPTSSTKCASMESRATANADARWERIKPCAARTRSCCSSGIRPCFSARRVGIVRS